MAIAVRKALPDDAAIACEVVRRSIRVLCTADHHDDPATIEAWLANKTEAKVRGWISAQVGVVAVRDDAIVGFGLLHRSGKLMLLYVDPDARLCGISAAMLAALETAARELGIAELALESSLTALRFYERRGYRRTDGTALGFGVMVCYPMTKRL